MKVKITFENSENNLEVVEKNSTIVAEVNAYVETDEQQNWDLKPPFIPNAFLKGVREIKSISLYKNKQNNLLCICADFDLEDQGISGCELDVFSVEEVDDFPRFKPF